MINAIITQLKTGSITEVITRGEGEYAKNPSIPYIVVYDAVPISSVDGQIVAGVYVDVHHRPGTLDIIDDYLDEEVVTLLHKVFLTDSKGNTFRLHDNDDKSILIDTNDDGTISKSKLFLAPKLGSI